MKNVICSGKTKQATKYVTAMAQNHVKANCTFQNAFFFFLKNVFREVSLPWSNDCQKSFLKQVSYFQKEKCLIWVWNTLLMIS